MTSRCREPLPVRSRPTAVHGHQNILCVRRRARNAEWQRIRSRRLLRRPLILRLRSCRRTSRATALLQQLTVTYAVTGTRNPNYKQADYRFGQNVAADSGLPPGSVHGWANEPAVMPANDVTATGYFVARTDTAYQVQHYKQNLEDDGFTLAETEKLTARPIPSQRQTRRLTGFTLDGTVKDTVASGNIAVTAAWC